MGRPQPDHSRQPGADGKAVLSPSSQNRIDAVSTQKDSLALN